MSSISEDLRYSLRQLRRSPGFAATAVLTLGLGIGATTAMYSIVRGALLDPLPYPHQEDLVGIGFSRSIEAPNAMQTGETAAFFTAHAHSFSSLGVASGGSGEENFSVGDGRPLTIRTSHVSAGYLPTLGINPLLGRTFNATEDLPGSPSVVVLSEELWRRHLNADPAILGRSIHINAEPFTVIGVLSAAGATADSPDLWQPLRLSPADPGYDGTNFQLIGRLRRDVSVAQANAEAAALTPAIMRQFPAYLQWSAPGAPSYQEHVWPLHQVIVGEARSSVFLLSVAVVAVLLIACLNLAGLVTARSTLRRTELTLRSALGAAPSALLRLLLTESAILAFFGSILGFGLAHFASRALVAAAPISLPALQPEKSDFSVVIVALATGCATVAFFGLIPAIGLLRQGVPSDPFTGTRTVGSGGSQAWLGKALVIGQVALATTLLSAGALLLGTFLHMRSISPGLDAQDLYALQVNLKGPAYASAIHTEQFVAGVTERLRSIPGVQAVGAVNGLPLDGGLNDNGQPMGHPELKTYTEYRFVTPRYFSTVGTRLLRGTDFTDHDTSTSQPVALVNACAARFWFGNRSPIGEFVLDGKTPRRIIGIAGDVQSSSLVGRISPMIYIPIAQMSDETSKAVNGWFPTTFVLRTLASGGSAQPDLSASVAAAIASVDPEVPPSKFASMQSFIDRSVAAPRFFSWLAGAFAGFALLLTIIGLFGLLSYQVAARTRELGVRMALGARRSGILILVISRGLILTSMGLAIGVLASLTLRKLLVAVIADSSHLRLRDTAAAFASPIASIGYSALAMLLAAFAASLLPATRASSIEPAVALRGE